MSASPTERVSSTYELSESISSNLDMKDLLNFQRVSKSFKSVIDRSIKIQQKLFFQPIPHERGTNAAVVINLFALRASGCPDPGDFANHTYGFHIWVFRMAAPVDTVGHGSWRNMLLFQPSCDWVRLAPFCELTLAPKAECYIFGNNEQRLGTIVDALNDKNNSSRFRTVCDEGEQRYLEAQTAQALEMAYWF